jgi:hypothetical protein
MDEYLSSLGTPLETESEFTVNTAAALRKMSRFQLPDPALWAVKMVQGAVAAGCFGVEFKFTRTAIVCQIYGAPIPAAHDLLKVLLRSEAPRTRAIHHWVVALRSLFGHEVSRWGWASQVDGVREQVDVVDGEVHTRSLPSEHPVDSFEVKLEVESTKGLKPSAGFAEYRHVCHRCRLCPIPVTADGRLVSRQHPAGLVRADYAAVWFERAGQDEPFFLYPAEADEGKRTKPVVIASKALREKECSRIVMVAPSCGRGAPTSSVYWLRDGALVGPVGMNPPPRGIQVQVICPGDHLAMDLSEWGVREPDRSFPADHILRSLREMGDNLRPRKSKSVKFDRGEFQWLTKLGVLSEFVGDILEILGKSEEKVGLPEEFVDGLDDYCARPFLSLARL